VLINIACPWAMLTKRGDLTTACPVVLVALDLLDPVESVL
jgi:hypothetical protein